MSSSPSHSPPGALQGLKVLECASIVAGPLCGRLLADFGAEVIHIEHPAKGDHLRQFGFTIDGVNPWWKYYARNKKLITLDVSKDAGRDLLLRLAADADIFIENFRPGRMEAWGLGYDELAKINPRLVMIRVTGYGQYGPKSREPGFGTIAEAMSGFAEMTGEADGPPTIPQFPLADNFTGFYAVMSAMFAIYNRDIVGTGKGQVIDVSILESLFSALGPNALVRQMTGRSPRRMGNRTRMSAPRNTYRTKDEVWIAIAGSTQETAARLFAVMGQPDLIKDDRFSSNSRRVENVEVLDTIIIEWMAARTYPEIAKLLEVNSVPFGPVNDIAMIMEDPHAIARDMIIEVMEKDGRRLKMEGIFPKFSQTPGEVRHTGGDIGCDNDEIYRGRLGLTTEQMASLAKDGVI
jgi:crotonobetainyl-CoA:carnitine CoA-transferase CaiB-like acyl-CoA transferase